MGRILAIDFGQKRVGIAVTDPMQIIANGLTTVNTPEIFTFLKEYFSKEDVDTVVVGYPKTLMNKGAEALEFINPFLKKMQKVYPKLDIQIHDERFTSKLAVRAMITGGMKKKDRQNKGNIDKISATIILQSFMEKKNNIL